MFDTMTITKAFASVCGAMLVLLLGGWAAEGLYNIDRHGEDHVPGYAILTEEEGEAEVEEEVVEVAFCGRLRKRRCRCGRAPLAPVFGLSRAERQ